MKTTFTTHYNNYLAKKLITRLPEAVPHQIGLFFVEFELRGWDVEKVVLNGLKTNFENFGFCGELNFIFFSFGSKTNFEILKFFVGLDFFPMNLLVGLKLS